MLISATVFSGNKRGLTAHLAALPLNCAVARTSVALAANFTV